MNALVTGGAGFIGSHLCEALLVHDYKVTVIDDLSTGSLQNLNKCFNHNHFTFFKDTILNPAAYKNIPYDIDVIFHLAAAVGVKYILDHPLASIHTNVMGTECVLEFANRNKSKVIFASTSEVYGKSNKAFLKEDDDRVLGATHITRWHYSCSKSLDEFMAFAYYRKCNLPIVISRMFNICGPRQSSEYGMVIPRFVQQALSGIPITVYGTGEQIRSFTYISDAITALMRLATEEKCVGEVFNIGGNEPIAIRSLAYLVKEKVGGTSEVVFIPYEDFYGRGFEDMERRIPDISKIKKFVDFEPLVGIQGILDRTIEAVKRGEELVAH